MLTIKVKPFSYKTVFTFLLFVHCFIISIIFIPVPEVVLVVDHFAVVAVDFAVGIFLHCVVVQVVAVHAVAVHFVALSGLRLILVVYHHTDFVLLIVEDLLCWNWNRIVA